MHKTTPAVKQTKPKWFSFPFASLLSVSTATLTFHHHVIIIFITISWNREDFYALIISKENNLLFSIFFRGYNLLTFSYITSNLFIIHHYFLDDHLQFPMICHHNFKILFIYVIVMIKVMTSKIIITTMIIVINFIIIIIISHFNQAKWTGISRACNARP